LDGNIDGVDVFDNLEQSEFILIFSLLAVNIAQSTSPEYEKSSFSGLTSFIVGVH
jgi:hypothetical protein